MKNYYVFLWLCLMFIPIMGNGQKNERFLYYRITKKDLIHDSIHFQKYPVYTNAILIRKSHETGLRIYFLARENRMHHLVDPVLIMPNQIPKIAIRNIDHSLAIETFLTETWLINKYNYVKYESFMCYASIASNFISSIISDGKYWTYSYPSFMNKQDYNNWQNYMKPMVLY